MLVAANRVRRRVTEIAIGAPETRLVGENTVVPIGTSVLPTATTTVVTQGNTGKKSSCCKSFRNANLNLDVLTGRLAPGMVIAL